MNHLTEKVQIVADDRERPSGVISELEKLDQAIVRIDRLSLGDYLVDDAILIERKSARDFAQSLIERRLFGQASRLVRTNLRPAYIIEGTSDGWSSLQVPRSALQGALITLSLIFDILVFRSFNIGETARGPPARFQLCAISACKGEAKKSAAVAHFGKLARHWQRSRKKAFGPLRNRPRLSRRFPGPASGGRWDWSEDGRKNP
jgi:ERCC4 domain